MRRLATDFQQDADMSKRLGPLPARESLFESALDLLTDGIALLRRDGRIVYANEALRMMAAQGGDFRLDRNVIEFASSDLRSRFAAALSALEHVEEPATTFLVSDFAVPREQGRPPYTVSVRPLARGKEEMAHPDAAAMMLVHDPLLRNRATGHMLRELYGLTNAESELVQALSSGMTAVAYAQSRRISITTVYTHLRRTREKTGWKSVAELTRRFHELNVALRVN